MANVWYSAGVDALMKGLVDLQGGTIAAVLVDTPTYTFSAAHTSLADIPAGARKATVTLSGKSVSNRIFTASNFTFTAVPAGGPYEAIVFYKSTGTDSTSTLIIYVDSANGLPVTANNNDVQIQPNAGGIGTL